MKKYWKEQNLKEAEQQAAEIEDAGHKVYRYGSYHWCIDGHINVWPSVKKFMKGSHVYTYNHLREVYE